MHLGIYEMSLFKYCPSLNEEIIPEGQGFPTSKRLEVGIQQGTVKPLI